MPRTLTAPTAVGREQTSAQQSGDRPILPRSLRRDIIFLIIIKIAALILIYQLFFASAETSRPTPATVSAHIVTAPQPNP